MCQHGDQSADLEQLRSCRLEYFTYTCVLNGSTGTGNQGYTLTATGSAGRAIGHTFSITHDNVQRTTVFKGATVAKSCWVTRGSEC